MNENLK